MTFDGPLRSGATGFGPNDEPSSSRDGGAYGAAISAQSAIAYQQIMCDRWRDGTPQADELGGPGWQMFPSSDRRNL